jgi:Exo-beta-D-glucosaminidase Ig-fold domain/Glycosyl hydrolases family 2/F5/8 type C domain/Glycosyl hydrolases family 2, sugar binding domain
MSPSRRDFLKTTAIASTGMALSRHAFAAEIAPGQSLPIATPATGTAANFTRGIGLYPGARAENFDPELILDTTGAYRNLALLRPAFHSSAYDYNLTAQLVTDGIADTHLPDWITTVVNDKVLPEHQREFLTNHSPEALVDLTGEKSSVELHLGGGASIPEIDRIGLFLVVPDQEKPATLAFTVFVSDDGHTWKQAGTSHGGQLLPPENYPPDMAHNSLILAPSVPLDRPYRSRHYRIEFGYTDPNRLPYISSKLGQVEFYRAAERIQIGGPYSFTSAWKSASLDEEWVYVDLGGRFLFDRVKLHWIARAAEGKLQVSNDATTWRTLMSLPAAAAQNDDLHLAVPTRGRYVRVLMTRPSSPDGYILSEFEVYGRGGFIARPRPRPTPEPNTADLAGGPWRLQRAGTETGESLSVPGFEDTHWIAATVPGTILSSYLTAGAIPDPNFGQNQLQISDSFFYSDFWYRTEFASPSLAPGQIARLNFDGVNWKAEVFLNGEALGRIDGGFIRGRFNITAKLHAGKPNALAVRVIKNATPSSCKQKTFESTGNNGGGLGADNPTYHASVGWDWIPTIRGRNTGLWGPVHLSTTGAVTLEDPLVTSVISANHASADVTLECIATNHTAAPVDGTIHARFGTLAFDHPITLKPNAREAVKLTPATHPQLRIANPELWWPAGYGDPHLYDVTLSFETAGKTSDHTAFKAGIRQMTSSEDGGALHLWINGRRFIARGGNWGFGESNLRYRAREYDAAVRYHREMNFTMIRNWVGQIGDDALYEACDRHGIVIWQDFWLANPWDGPIPDDNAMFLANTRDFIQRIRRHASVGLYCGRNEWFPPAALEKGIRALLAELHPDLAYIGSSADGPVSGHGPYRAMDPPFYFRTADTKLHSELGAPNIPTLDSVRAMMPESAMWPQALDWGLHDFTLAGAQGGITFRTMIDENYGGATNAADWISLAQFINYDTYRAMFEAQGQHRMGLLLWMSHPCWPSFVWQTYDYYLEPTAAYFGCKKASEPLHIQWNSAADTIEVVNYSAGSVDNLSAQIEILDSTGKTLSKKTVPVQSREDTVSTIAAMSYPTGLTPVHFLRLTLEQNGKPRSTNFYLRGIEQGNFRALRAIPRARVHTQTSVEQRGATWLLTTTLENTSTSPALMLRLKAVRDTTGDRILPAIYDDNYIALMPNERRTITTELNHADTRGERPRIVLEGFNLLPS